jgi:NTE family protein
VDHQIPFYGIGDIEWYDRLFSSAMFETRYRIGKRHYVSLIGNAAAWGEEFNEMFDNPLWGGAINYAYDSFIGPITVTIADSNFGDKVTLIVSIGYVF